ncbi:MULTISPECIES: hypothetical protein [unclassified Rhodococcus (in: high G+C Gram-positive bacteria)]|uniref:hypothetical protein n=1 Tax=unclassified Rhodococcus (in: high G+C Gram-positive bacteria) TaxID=192944 RepID=UPI000B9B358B|nr:MULTISPECIES: hypothetical protein [unclassified Rhodococcus (in: high G+C Gram-positive bacteria)]OZE35640.1 hypothetical protein CH259_16570 [Rhodococcus sp. 05-2254-4]OZE48069.1 hypothetical protein CH261_09165 [Rhodococcus sp. 05-2254-3]OZE49280.1 hypothetical protein CH283_16950 [Rhodococcus sp. 05-2254-2]
MTMWNQQPRQQHMETEQMASMEKAREKREREARRAKLTTELKLEARDHITLADLDEIMGQTAKWDRNTIVSVSTKTYDQRGEAYLHTISIVAGRVAR